MFDPLTIEAWRQAANAAMALAPRQLPDGAANSTVHLGVDHGDARGDTAALGVYHVTEHWADFRHPLGVSANSPEAEARGMALLQEWLTEPQRRDLELFGFFHVTGSHSGKRYRICRGTVQNVHELDGTGAPVCGWCFAPKGALVAGDVMLAQKIALETDERAALRVANAFNDRRPWFGHFTVFEVVSRFVDWSRIG